MGSGFILPDNINGDFDDFVNGQICHHQSGRFLLDPL
ncbi:hypothetical protein CPT_Muenster_223 [Klebsiella phage Muenster]|nr:hypothetical protein CPT_Muenster_223 [Klebsiella phage Muenster]